MRAADREEQARSPGKEQRFPEEEEEGPRGAAQSPGKGNLRTGKNANSPSTGIHKISDKTGASLGTKSDKSIKKSKDNSSDKSQSYSGPHLQPLPVKTAPKSVSRGKSKLGRGTSRGGRGRKSRTGPGTGRGSIPIVPEAATGRNQKSATASKDRYKVVLSESSSSESDTEDTSKLTGGFLWYIYLHSSYDNQAAVALFKEYLQWKYHNIVYYMVLNNELSDWSHGDIGTRILNI